MRPRSLASIVGTALLAVACGRGTPASPPGTASTSGTTGSAQPGEDVPFCEFARHGYFFDGETEEDAVVAKLRSPRPGDLYARILILARLPDGSESRVANASAVRGTVGGSRAEFLSVELAVPPSRWDGAQLRAVLETLSDRGSSTWKKELSVDIPPSKK